MSNSQTSFTGNATSGNRLLEIAVGERPQARMERFGPEALSDTELLALVVGGPDPIALATRLVAKAGSASALLFWRASDFLAVAGIGPRRAAELQAVLEIGRRALAGSAESAPVLNSADLVAGFLERHAAGLEVERFWVLCLNRRNRLIKCLLVTSGTATACLAHPREVFRGAIREGATAIVCSHNHPSGDPSPSAADLQLTRQLREASKAVDIALLDHVIIGRLGHDPVGKGFYSFRDAGLL